MPELKQLTLFETKLNSYTSICKALGAKDDLLPDQFGQQLKKWSKKSISKPINTLCLFSGAGGLDIGFHDAGFTTSEMVEIEDKFATTLLANQTSNYFANTKVHCIDVRDYQPTKVMKVDFIIGGPPCQSFSAAGRRAAGVKGTKDERGGLFEEYVRILRLLKPKGFLFENVYGLIGAEKGQAIIKIKRAFEKEGYNLSYRILDTADYGVPQHRERLIIVGVKKGTFLFPRPTHGPDSLNQHPYLPAAKALSGLQVHNVSKNGINGRFGHLLNDIPEGLNYSFFTEKMGHPNPIFAWRSKFSDFLYKADRDKPVRTIKASGGQYTGPFHWDNRKFEITELKRLQTFPDDYNIIGAYGLASKQIGNSVPPQFARILALSVLDQIFKVQLPFQLEYLEDYETLSFRRLKSQRTHEYSSKAKLAIGDNQLTPYKKIKGRKYVGSITKGFHLKEGKSESDLNFNLSFKPQRGQWNFELNELFQKGKDIGKQTKSFTVLIKNRKDNFLFQNIKEVILISKSSSVFSFTALWKAFESELIRNGIKADLVQLSGYYQYSSDLVYEISLAKKLTISKKNKLSWLLISKIVEDQNIGKIRSLNELSIDYNIAIPDLVEAFQYLRNLGFEIRNHNTNSEIPNNHYLIPYKFPTLNPLSVQLNKFLS